MALAQSNRLTLSASLPFRHAVIRPIVRLPSLAAPDYGRVGSAALVITLAALSLLHGHQSVFAQTFAYNFEQLAEGTTTPIDNLTALSGRDSLRASFMSTPVVDAFYVLDFGEFDGDWTFGTNALLSAENSPGSGSTLVITFDRPVSRLSLDFAVGALLTDEPAKLGITTAASSVEVAATGESYGGFQGGAADAQLRAATRQVVLNAFDSDGGVIDFAIDNLFVDIGLVGDFNSDGVVDVLDLDILGANFGLTDATLEQGDANGDGTVDVLDLDLLGANFSSTAAAVPEPGAAVLTLVGLLVTAKRASRSKLSAAAPAGCRGRGLSACR